MTGGDMIDAFLDGFGPGRLFVHTRRPGAPAAVFADDLPRVGSTEARRPASTSTSTLPVLLQFAFAVLSVLFRDKFRQYALLWAEQSARTHGK